ncbi:extracellular solute-binding protein [Cohnella herbarum]|uniref:Extracellular solute-binding protein n=1 Tax=Cohnella herbarum TaxID=2728023 RepID=A0A7Z2VP36_9BACL|nr:extracellular solute-binding protein [Cohnella herbarum]QJD86578.1 extracellular solute-binding protein [Cohnella herbarum]
MKSINEASRQTKYRLLTAALACTVLLAGCSGNNGNNASTGEASPATASQSASVESPSAAASESTAPEDGPMTKYEQPIEVTIGQSNYEASSFIEGESVDSNIHHKFNEEYLNIKYKNKWVVDATKAGEKVNLVIASDDLPDVMKVGLNQLQMLIKNGQVEDLTEAWAKYPTEKVRSMAEYQDKIAFLPATKEGKIYGIPLARDFGESIGIMYVRQDWLDKLKLQAPTNLQELEAVAKAFVNDDPDGNGKKDTYGIGFDKEMGFVSGQPMLTSIAAGFKAYPKLWVKDDSGNFAYGSIQPQMKETLAFLQNMYKLGALDPEFAVKDFAKVTEMYTNGKIGILFGVFSAPIYPLMTNKEADPKAEWTVLPIPSGADGQVAPAAKSFVNEWIVVRKGFEHPEAAIKSMNLWAEMFVGPNEYNDRWAEANSGAYSGKNINLYALPYNFDSPYQNLKNGENLRAAKESGDESKLDVREQWILSEKNKGGSYGWAIEKTFYEAEKVLLEYKNIRYSDYQGAPTPSMISKSPTLDKLELETFIKIIMGASLDEFDRFVEKWRALGGDQITQEVNEAAK